MPLQPLDSRSCALSIHSALSSNPPTLRSFSAEEGDEVEALGLLSQLLQQSFLNGTCPEDSVWTALDNLVPPSLTSPKLAKPFPFFTLHRSVSTIQDPAVEALDDGSICVSFPLKCRPDSSKEEIVEQIQVVLHTIELIEVEVGRATAEKGTRPKAVGETDLGAVEKKWWDFEWLHPNRGEGETDSGHTKQKVTIAKKIFDPPKDRLSIRATWWGYEIYLPEPVFRDFGDNVESVLTSLSYLSTGLALLLTHAPAVIAALPGFPLLQSILPILSAIISAVTWYWKTMKKMDLGEGVTLSATWILPIAVVPRPLRRKGEEEPEGDSLSDLKDEAVFSKKGDGKENEISTSKQPAELVVQRANKLRRVWSRTKK